MTLRPTKNVVIRASAGTGKTYSLATRFLYLMMFKNVRPETILALTFSRAAAQEIYTKLLERLWKAAGDDAVAQKEYLALVRENGGVPREGGALTRASFVRVLRDVVEKQNRGTIATLDSFILRLVQNFPLELGFQSAVNIIDTYEEKRAVGNAWRALLNDTGSADDFFKNFGEFSSEPWPRGARKVLDQLTNSPWYGFSHAHHEEIFTANEMAKALGVADVKTFQEEPPAIKAFPDETEKVVAEFAEAIDGFNGKQFLSVKSERLEVKAFWNVFLKDATAVSFSYESRGKTKTVSFLPEVARAIHADYARAVALFLRRRLDESAARLAVLRMVDRVYHAQTRRAGMLTFDDLPQVRQTFERTGRAGDVANLEYRFDSTFEHWALDEFQDTSAVQWACLRNLVESAATDDTKSVMVVGDLKQAIYAWRGGDEKPFLEMMQWPSMCGVDAHGQEIAWQVDGLMGAIRDNDTSYRYGQHICDFLNRVFGKENLLDPGPVKQMLAPGRGVALSRWLDRSCWREHQPVYDEATGKLNDADYVKVIGVPIVKETSSEDDEEEEALIRRFGPAIFDEVNRLWEAHEAAVSTETIGILVRKNTQGTALARYLRKRGLSNVVWEGVSGILDVPAVHLVLDVLTLADHPQDVCAWEEICRSPVARLLSAGVEHVDLSSAENLSAWAGERLSRDGLSRTLRMMTVVLCAPEAELDALSVMRLNALVRVAIDFENHAKPTDGMTEFFHYLTSCVDRELASSSSVIRILTIHRSKGLTIDRTIVPFMETSRFASIEIPQHNALLLTAMDGVSWVMDGISEKTAVLNPAVMAAWNARCDEMVLENLHLCYVALTRARKGLSVIVALQETKTISFSSVICAALPPWQDDVHDKDENQKDAPRVLFESGTEPTFKKKEHAVATVPPWDFAQSSETVKRASPSAGGGEGFESRVTLASLFREDAGSAAMRGREKHERYAAITWLDPASPEAATEFGKAFIKPEGVVELWREKSYELVIHGVWESGRFDRVVFTKDAMGKTHATVYDFKTDRKHEDESVDVFHARLAKTYSGQMAAYRRAVSFIAGISEDAVTTVLLAEYTGTAIHVNG